ncbi:DUF2484 family protein [Hasllibacter sp. MH4015]|uniref:DUF2484 family protein n=1 Tax=Hasllibacter sp. MH4015 TaxID=2854029 RepID=UPI001CD414A1|nr:DUF2484 family protein [Hasllibacter sp. MH4015]
MSLALTLACLWVLASAITAMLPYRMQFPPGIALLVASVPLTIFVGYSHGWFWIAVIVFAIGSMFRNPLRYFWNRAMGRAS